MNKPILSAAIALPLVIASAASSFANEAVRIAQVTRTSVTTDAFQPTLTTPNAPNLQIDLDRQQLGPSSGDTRERPKPHGPGGSEALQTSSQAIPSFGDTRERPKPKGPGGSDPAIQIVPGQQQLR